jgi:hypothetical protein
MTLTACWKGIETTRTGWRDRDYSLKDDPLWIQMPKAQPFDKLGFYHCDHLGTPQEITDEEGNIAWSAQYRAWGEAKEVISKAERNRGWQPLTLCMIFMGKQKMVIGDPYKFAFIIDLVPDWNSIESKEFVQGVFFMSIDGVLYPKKIITTTLSSDLWYMFGPHGPHNAFLTLPANTDIFNLEKELAFIELYKITYPCVLHDDNRDSLSESMARNNYTYLGATTEITDNWSYVFVVRSNEKIRILGAEIVKKRKHGEISYFVSNQVKECFISSIELRKLVRKLKSFYLRKIIGNDKKTIEHI